jgi:RNA polymerase sigma-70 factor (ECF subfamily)
MALSHEHNIPDQPDRTASQAPQPELLQRIARDHDPQAFRDLFVKYGPRVKAMMMRQGADAETAEDITQDTMLAIWRKAHLFVEQKGSITTWIYTIARNLRIDRLRRQVVWLDIEEEAERLESADEPADITVARGEIQDRVRGALSLLPPEQFEAVQLSYVEGLSHHEISERLNMPLGTVKSRIRLAYQKIKDTIGDAAL